MRCPRGDAIKIILFDIWIVVAKIDYNEIKCET
jgi:hypothetical protein